MSANLVELNSAVLTHLSKLADKWADRDDLTDGAAYEITGTCHGTINGNCFALPIDGTLTVGHESVKASSVTPKQSAIVAAILAKLNTATRTKIVQDLLDEYRETGDIQASEHMVDMADMLLGGLRKVNQVTRRGDVRVNTQTRECMMSVEIVDAA